LVGTVSNSVRKILVQAKALGIIVRAAEVVSLQQHVVDAGLTARGKAVGEDGSLSRNKGSRSANEDDEALHLEQSEMFDWLIGSARKE